MADVFISYAREDRAFAAMLAAALSAHGWSVWWDFHIVPGKDFGIVLQQELADACCVVVLWSSRSVLSEYVRDEASDAKEREILVAAQIETVRPPLGFRQRHVADLVDWSGQDTHSEYRGLVSAIAELVPVRPGPTVAVASVDAAPSNEIGAAHDWPLADEGTVADAQLWLRAAALRTEPAARVAAPSSIDRPSASGDERSGRNSDAMASTPNGGTAANLQLVPPGAGTTHSVAREGGPVCSEKSFDGLVDDDSESSAAALGVSGSSSHEGPGPHPDAVYQRHLKGVPQFSRVASWRDSDPGGSPEQAVASRVPFYFMAALALVLVVFLAYQFLSKTEPGRLQLITHPADATVLFNRRPVGTRSPFVITNVMPSIKHELQVKKESYRDWTQEVQIQPGQTLQFPVSLEPDDATAPSE